jgi:hypothetical protein
VFYDLYLAGKPQAQYASRATLMKVVYIGIKVRLMIVFHVQFNIMQIIITKFYGTETRHTSIQGL